MQPITRSNLLVAVIGFAAALLLMAFVTSASLPVFVAVGVAGLIWVLRVAARADMVYSVIGITIGVLVALLVPGLRTIVGPDTALLGSWIFLALAA